MKVVREVGSLPRHRFILRDPIHPFLKFSILPESTSGDYSNRQTGNKTSSETESRHQKLSLAWLLSW